MRGQGSQVNLIVTDTIEETAGSPQGVWYTTKVRRHFPTPASKPILRDQVFTSTSSFRPTPRLAARAT